MQPIRDRVRNQVIYSILYDLICLSQRHSGNPSEYKPFIPNSFPNNPLPPQFYKSWSYLMCRMLYSNLRYCKSDIFILSFRVMSLRFNATLSIPYLFLISLYPENSFLIIAPSRLLPWYSPPEYSSLSIAP